MGSLDRRAFLGLALGSAGVALLGRGEPRRTSAPAREAAAPVKHVPPPAPPPPMPAAAAAPPAPPPVALEDLPEKVVFTNAGGRWHVWKALTWSPEQDRVVGPGYVGQLERPGGLVAVDDFREPGPLNDPRYGGLGAFGWQHARAGQGMWDVHGRLDAAANGGFGVARSAVTRGPQVGADGAGELEVRVEFRDGWADPVMAATYAYRVEPDAVLCSILVEELWAGDGAGQPFVKEPKVVASVLAPAALVQVLDPGGAVLEQIDLSGLPDPSQGTAQIDDAERAAVRFLGDGPVEIGVDGRDFDRWAQLSEARPRLADGGGAYCLAGGALKRRWEVVKRPAEASSSCIFPAWQGGSGYPDCASASRAFGPYGESFTIAARFA